jgi:hypothetical protein
MRGCADQCVPVVDDISGECRVPFSGLGAQFRHVTSGSVERSSIAASYYLKQQHNKMEETGQKMPPACHRPEIMVEENPGNITVDQGTIDRTYHQPT